MTPAPDATHLAWVVAGSAVRVSLDPDPPLRGDKRTAPYHLVHFPYEPLTSPRVTRTASGAAVSRPDDLLPRLAAAWEPDAAFRTWTIRLRPDVRSHAGNRLTAQDVKWAWDRTFALRGVGLWRSRRMAGLATSDNVTVLDDHTIRFALDGPNPEFPQYFVFATNNVVDSVEACRHATSADPWATDWLSRNVAGYGALSLEAHTDEAITFQARDDYYLGRPGLDSVQLVAADGREQGLRMLERGEANFAAGLFPDELARFAGRPEFTVGRVQANHSTLELNWQEPPFDDQRVRQAIAYALPYQRIIDQVYRGYADISRSPISPVCRNYSAAAWHYDTDRAKARALLAESTVPDGFATELYIRPSGESLRFAEIAREALGAIGIQVEVRLDTALAPGTKAPMWFKDECGHALNEAMYDLGHDYDPPLGMWGGRNIRDTRWTEPLKAIRQARAEEQPGLYAGYQRAILDFAPCVHIAELQAGTVVRGRLDDWAFSEASLGLTSTVWTGDRQLLPWR